MSGIGDIVGTDPIRLEVIRAGLAATADEMAIALQRAAYSTNVKTRQDFSCAIFDAQLRVVAQSFSVPTHLGSLTSFVPGIVNRYGIEKLQDGDVVICNDGYRSGGVHLNDVTAVAPMYVDGELTAFMAALAHHVDVGGGNPGSMGLAREIYGEGLMIPPTLLVRDGEFDDSILRFILNNVRSPRESGGDLRAQIAGVNIGRRRLSELAGKYGRGELVTSMDALLDYTERRVRHSLAEIPHGVYEAEGFMDNDGIVDVPVRIAVRIEIDENGVRYDLTGSAPQCAGPINSTYAMTLSSCAYALRCLLDSDLPTNDGFYRVFDIVAPLGTVVNATEPAPISVGWETGLRVTETALRALGDALPERITAGSKGCLSNISFGGIDPRTDRYFTFYEAVAGGYGGRAHKDGIDAIQPHGQNTENSPVEEVEANYPLRVLRYALVPDSEGPGRQRGGLGLRRDYVVEGDVSFSVLADRGKFPPWGFAGGMDADVARYVRNPDTDREEQLPSKFSLRLAPGETVRVQMAGGGGYGDPRERDPERVLADVREEKITVARARTAYGVVIDAETLELDRDATARERGVQAQGGGETDE
ncbi:MAG TPA: hydantoinase B/oxoprolinase family protein [Gaiellaceae bacterium]|nr:hydantoinase B/oxoprolinase family protein [Gaiellaceae bacterium]